MVAAGGALPAPAITRRRKKMSPRAGEMLLRHVRPIIRAALARGVVKTVGCEDLPELEADGMAQAAAMLDSAETAGKELMPASVAFYVLQALRSGRRSGCASRTDAMSPATALDRKVTLVSLDEPVFIDNDDSDEEFTLHACLAASGEDPALQGSRELDWERAMNGLEANDCDLLRNTASGVPGTEMAFMYGVTPARVTQRKRELGGRLRESLGTTVLAECVREPLWEGYMRAYREKRACRYK